jgi:hypothetical protein
MGERYLSAYYFMSTDLCMNRAHVRSDMTWLAAHSFDAIHTAVHEEAWRQPKGLRLIVEEAHAAGLAVLAIPSRWCGLVAGWPVLAGHFAATRPDTWMLGEDGRPVFKPFCGPVCSVHHPDVRAHMVGCVERMLSTWDLDGITWDELKTLHCTDRHPAATERFGGPAAARAQIDATLEVFAACNRAARAVRPDLRIVSFIYAHLPDEVVVPWAATAGFDDVGPDGKLARRSDLGETKVLLDNLPRFMTAARAAGRRSFCLIETQDADVRAAELALTGLPELLALGVEHVAVYYHPLVNEPAAQITDRIGPPLRDWRRGGA